MPIMSHRVTRPTAIRLTEVENAVLDVLDVRGVRPGNPVFVGDIETAMDSRGYAGKWVKRALESLIRKGFLRVAGPRYLEQAENGPPEPKPTPAGKPARRKPVQRRRRAALF
jgi:hypothetical protein